MECTTYADDDDAELVQAALTGDMAAYARLLERHRPMLLALCRRTLGDGVLAEDAAQEASLQALLKLRTLTQAARFGAWLAGIGINTCRMWQRSRARETCSWDALQPRLERGTSSDPERERLAELLQRAVAHLQECDDPQDNVITLDVSMRVRDAVAELPPGQRAAVHLFYLRGLTYEETAAELGIGVGAVRTRLHKARGALREPLQPIWREQTMDTTVQPETKVYICSFCSKTRDEVRRMIAGPKGVIICNECVALCNELIASEEAKDTPTG